MFPVVAGLVALLWGVLPVLPAGQPFDKGVQLAGQPLAGTVLLYIPLAPFWSMLAEFTSRHLPPGPRISPST